MSTTLWLLIGLLPTALLAFNIGYYLGERAEKERRGAVQAIFEDELKRERARTATFLKMTQDLQRQLVRIQRASVSLPEVGPREPEEEVKPPPELVRICAAFGDQGVRLLQQAKSQYRQGIDWKFILSGLRRQISEQNPEALKIIEGEGEE